MATSNRDRVGHVLELLSAGLDAFIARAVTERVPPDEDWTALLAAKDAGKGIGGKTYERSDVQNQLRMLTETVVPGWFPFDAYLSRAEKSLASELRDVRDKWAHQKSFSADDTYRALDTAERLLRAAGAVPQADETRSLRVDLQRREYDTEVARAARTHTAVTGFESQGLPAWRDVLTPHPDVAAGRYATSEFAADLHQVAFGNDDATDDAGQEYRDPVEFFRRTYLTDGLKDLLRRAAARLSGDMAADPVINLQTNFGGGKTHSMLAVWHLVSGHPVASYPQDVQELLDGTAVAGGKKVGRVALAGNEIAPNLPIRTEDGVEVNTLWGELAWQLGGRDAYDMLAEADRTGTNPGAALKRMLAAYSPCVILIDEWVAYARGLYTRDDLRGGTFDTQFTFAQTLTGAVAATPGAVLLVSIPASDVRADHDGRDASDLEIGGAHGREALERLQNVIGRTSYEWRPASAQESFEIVRRRLFVDANGDSRTRIAVTAQRFVEFYRSHHGEFPKETTDNDYIGRIKAAYPIHPELFDRLYEDWSSLERFQRTRGVLRLMSAVVHTLSSSDDPSPLIMPGTVPLDSGGVRNEVSKYLEDNWAPILDADVDGDTSTPVRIDAERPLFGKRALTRRIARALFLGSAATLRSAHKGIERQRLFLGVAQPGDTVGNFGSALQLLTDNATYLYSDGERYWYDVQPSLNRKAAEYASGLTPEDVWAEIVTRIGRTEKAQPGQFTAVEVAPESSAEVAEPDGVRLVVLHPRFTHSGKGNDSAAYRFIDELIASRGTAPRERRNLIVALAADTQRYAELESAVRNHLAWRHLVGRINELDLTQQQAAVVRRRSEETNRVVDQRVPTTYIWVMYPEQPDGAKPLAVRSLKVEGAEQRLAVRTSARLIKEQLLLTEIGAQNVRLALDNPLRRTWNDGRISVHELWEFYQRHPYLDRLRNRRVLEEGIRAALDEMDWEGAAFALAESYDKETGDFDGLVLPGPEAHIATITDATLLVAPHLATAQHERESRKAGTELPSDGNGPASLPGGGGQPLPPTREKKLPAATPNVRYQARVSIKPDRDIAAQLREVAEEILTHLVSAGPDALDITLTVRAERIEGFDQRTVRTVTENGAQLGFVGNRFEDG
jgi:hypothetical protein